MAKDASLYVRRAVVSRLKAEAAVAAIVGNRVSGPSVGANPTWPFVRVQPSTAAPFLATCLDGSRIAFRVSGFSKGTDADRTEGEAAVLAQAIGSALDGLSVPLTDAPWPARLTDIRWTGTQIIQDAGEASAFHAIVSFEATVTS